ncbi:ATP-binding protein [Paenibacillus psychroresistens]|nr:ATP-binding protein [Paenibacillus psychroresistens]
MKWIHSYPTHPESKKAADIIHSFLIQGTTLADRRVQSADFHVLRETKMAAVLVECGFMDNLAEAKLLLTDAYRSECAIEIARGACNYLGVTFIVEEVKPKMDPKTPHIFTGEGLFFCLWRKLLSFVELLACDNKYSVNNALLGENILSLMLESIIINFMFICAPSIVYFLVWIKYGKRSSYPSKIVLFFFLTFSIILCLSFPFHYQDKFMLDFRQVPLVIGVIYGGPLVGGALLVVLVITRYIIVDEGFYYGFIISLCTYVSLVAMTRKHHLGKRSKLIRVLIISTAIIPILIILLGIWVLEFQYQETKIIILHRIIVFVAISATVYLVEFLIGHFKMQKELQEIEKMIVVSQLAASVSHEIRNPLTTVRGLLQVFRERELPLEKRWNLTEVALNELDTAINIISDYLTFAKPQVVKMTFLNISDELQQVTSVLTPYANMLQVTLACVVDTAQPILGDSQQFRQCLINLVKNCIEASPNGRVDIAVLSNREHVLIRIKDNGVGMADEQIQRLGIPYYSTKEKGTGLGMMVVFSIIKAMNGTIKVESEINRGSLFVISFPLTILLKTD